MSDDAYIMIVIIFSLLVLTPVNCHLAFFWLNHQQLQCAQNTRNYREAVHHQYSCISSLTWTCIRDLNVYTPSSVISLAHFCGFIDGQNVKQSNTIWHIHVEPNIHVHFTKFSLFNNYWYCDSELLKVTSENKVNTFCGNRLPWVYDASAPSVNITLSTQRFGSTHYQVELQYYGAHIRSYQHFVVLLGPSYVMNAHFPDLMRNKFESFHFSSNNKLDIVNVAFVNMCSKQQIACHDGPGIKSPTLQILCNQSECKCLSTTFQMFCILSASAIGCLNVPQLNYHAVLAKQEEFKLITKKISSTRNFTFEINERVNRGSTKYVYISSGCPYSYMQRRLTVKMMRISFPYMLYEGHSCIYGGIYIMEGMLCAMFSSNVLETLSLCSQSNRIKNEEIILGYYFAIVIIHYKEYSGSTIIFEAAVQHTGFMAFSCFANIATAYNKSIKITLSFRDNECELHLQSMRLNLRNIEYVYITFQRQNISSVIWFTPRNKDWCIYCTVFYRPHLSNIIGEEYEKEVLNRTFTRDRIIYFISINTSTCNSFVIPVWSLSIKVKTKYKFTGINTVGVSLLSGHVWWKVYELHQVPYTAPF